MEREYTTKITDNLMIDVRGVPVRASKNDASAVGFDAFTRDFKTDIYFDTGTVYIDWVVNFIDHRDGYELEQSIRKIRASLEFVESMEDSNDAFEMEIEIDSSDSEWTIDIESDTIIQLGSFIGPQSIDIDLLDKTVMVNF